MDPKERHESAENGGAGGLGRTAYSPKDVWDFVMWVRVARRGERAIYHIGDLVVDREQRHPGSHLRSIAASKSGALADAAMGAHMRGEIMLTRERVAPGRPVFNYIATRTAKRIGPRPVSDEMRGGGNARRAGHWW